MTSQHSAYSTRRIIGLHFNIAGNFGSKEWNFQKESFKSVVRKQESLFRGGQGGIFSAGLRVAGWVGGARAADRGARAACEPVADPVEAGLTGATWQEGCCGRERIGSRGGRLVVAAVGGGGWGSAVGPWLQPTPL